MKIMLDKDTDVSIAYTSLNYGKLVLDIDNSQIENVASELVEHLNESIGIKILNALDFEDVMNYYGVVQVLEWAEANR